MLTGRQPNPAKLELLKNNANDSLDKFEELFLSDGPFINGHEISFADIQASCEIEQPSKCFHLLTFVMYYLMFNIKDKYILHRLIFMQGWLASILWRIAQN